MMKLRKMLYIVLCLMAGVLSGCIEEYEADIADEDSNLLVVEGTICSGQFNKFYLSRTQSINTSYIPRMDMRAKVSVRGSDGSEYPATAIYDYYGCWTDELQPDVDYYLHIEIDGEVYESEPQKPLRTEKIADVCGVQNTPDSNIDVLVTPADPFEPDRANYYSWTYDATWLVYPDYVTYLKYDTINKKPVNMANPFPKCGWMDEKSSTVMIGASTSYAGQHIQKLKLYEVDCTSPRIYYRYSGLVHQRAITKAEYEYELARRQADSDMGGLFTPQPSSLPTNIRCLTSHKRVIGYVGCSLNTSAYRFFFNAEDFMVHRTRKKDTRIWLDDPTPDECCRMVERGLFLCEWEDAMIAEDGKTHAAWAHDYQLDVRCNGAYIEEPDFWSLTENVSY